MIEVSPGFQRRKSTKKLILHHTAAMSDLTLAEIDSMHKGNGWKGIGYCLYIRQAGDLHIGRGEDAVGAHAGSKSNMNSVSCGICLSGNFEIQHPTDAQIATLVPLLARLCRKYGLQVTDIIGHRDVTPTACPGRNFPMSVVRLDVSALLAAGSITAAAANVVLTKEQIENLMDSVRGLYQYWEQMPQRWRDAVNAVRDDPILPPRN